MSEQPVSTSNGSRLVPFLVTIIVLLVGILAFIVGRATSGNFGWFGHSPMMMFGEAQGQGRIEVFGGPRGQRDPLGPDMMGGGIMGSTTAGALTGADVMFLQMMIPHHEQAVAMSDLAIKNSKNTELLAIANAIKTGQTKEIAQMRQWLADNGVSETAGMGAHHGHDMWMGGMLSDAELSALAAAKGAEFDRLWLEGMIQHHEGALHMITMIQDSQNPELAAFATSIESVQTSEIARMKALL